MRNRRKHWYEIRAWADGWEIEQQYPSDSDEWSSVTFPIFYPSISYRVVPDSEGWLPWYGGECPVPGNTKVALKFENGYVSNDNYAGTWDWNENIITYRIIKEVDPYAELKAAAKDPTKQIRCHVGSCREWIDSNNNGTQWSWCYSPDKYEIRDKPKPAKKVKLLAWYAWDQLIWWTDGAEDEPYGVRIPSEDKEIEVEE